MNSQEKPCRNSGVALCRRSGMAVGLAKPGMQEDRCDGLGTCGRRGILTQNTLQHTAQLPLTAGMRILDDTRNIHLPRLHRLPCMLLKRIATEGTGPTTSCVLSARQLQGSLRRSSERPSVAGMNIIAILSR